MAQATGQCSARFKSFSAVRFRVFGAIRKLLDGLERLATRRVPSALESGGGGQVGIGLRCIWEQ